MTASTVMPIGDVAWRRRACIRGRVHTMRVRPLGGDVATLECTVVDDTGGITLVFLGRKQVAGIQLGGLIEAEGMVGENRERLVILNPVYRLIVE